MKSLTRKILFALSVVILALALAFGVSLIVSDAGDVSVANAAEAKVGSASYSSFENAWSAAQSSSESSQKTVTLTSNVSLTSQLTLDAGKYVTLDLAGYTIDTSGTTYGIGFYNIAGTLTIKDSTATYGTSTGTVGVSKYNNGYRTIFSVTDGEKGSSSKYYYTSGAITGGSNKNSSYYGAIRVTDYGVVNLYGGSIVNNTFQYGGAFALTGHATLNMYGGSVSKNIAAVNGGAIYMAGYASANLAGGVFYGNTCSESGGAIDYESYGTLSVGRYSSSVSSSSQMVFSANTAKNGGAIHSQYSSDKTYFYAGAVLTNNTTSEKGGALDSNGTTYVYDGAVISGNTCVSFGGGIYNSGKPLYMYGGTISYNTSTATSGTSGNGGGVYMSAGAMYMYGGVIHNNKVNSSGGGGGGIFATGSGGNIYMYDGAVIRDNTVAENGGGVMVYSHGTFTMYGGEITGNSADFGGAFYSASVNPSYNLFTMYDGTISGNSAKDQGGAGYLYGPATITGGTISGNTAGGTAGAFNVRTQKVTISGATISGNTSSSNGGAFYLADSSSVLTLTDCVITGNTAASYGGAIYIYNASGKATLTDCEMTGNHSSGNYGGAVYSNGVLSVSEKTVIQSNTSGSGYSENNVYLPSGKYVTLAGELGDGAYIGVTLASSTQTQVTATESSTSYYNRALRYFHFDSPSTYRGSKTLGYGTNCIAIISIDNYAARVDLADGTSAFYEDYSEALSAAMGGKSEAEESTMVLLCDLTITSSTVLTADADSYVTVDLNGYNIDVSATGRWLDIEGHLTLTDSTGTYAELGSTGTTGVTKNSDGTYTTTYRKSDPDTKAVSYYTYTSGAILGGSATSSDYGVIKVCEGGSLTMYGGTITGSTGYSIGAGVSVYGSSSNGATFSMYGGSISGNNNGALYISSYADGYVYGGIITSNVRKNTSTNNNGGIYVAGSAYLYIGECADSLAPIVISDNTGYHGTIYLSGSATAVMDSGFVEYNSVWDGGGFYVSSKATLTMNGGFIAHNTANGSAGGVYVNVGGFDMNGGEMYANASGKSYTSDGYGGGAIFIYNGGSATINGGLIDENTSGGYGGAINIYTSSSTLTITGGEIVNNTATSNGGGIAIHNAKVTIEGGSVSYNSAKNGGGIYSSGGTVTLDGGSVSYNTASNYGAGIYNSGTLNILSGDISYNTGASYGGGIYYGTVNMSGGYVSNNSANYGGAQYGGGLNMTGGYIVYNTAKYNVAGVYVTGNSYMYDGVIAGNVASRNGGGVEIQNYTFTMYGGYIVYNEAGQNGGGVALYSAGTFVMYDGLIYGNSAGSYGGGINTNTYSGQSMYLYGGEISGNTAGIAAAGIDDGSAEDVEKIYASIYMSGSIIVANNTLTSGEEDNVHLSSNGDSLINLVGALTEGASVGVTLSDKTQITKAESGTSYYQSSAKYFYLDDAALRDDYYIGYKNGKYLEMLPSSDITSRVDYYDGTSEFFASFSVALDAAVYTSENYANTLTLIGDVTFSDYGYTKSTGYVIEEGEYLDLDLSGCTLKLSSSNNKAFTVYGTLNLYDSTAVNERVDDSQDFGVSSNGDGTYTTYYKMTDEDTLETSTYAYTSGAITGGYYNGTSGAYYGTLTVYAGGTVNMYGGSIVNNTQHCAGGLYMVGSSDNKATFTMYGGSISGNTNYAPGGAVRAYDSDIYLYGGIMVRNALTGTSDATYALGGAIEASSGTYVYVADDSSSYVPVVLSDNTKVTYGGSIYFGSSSSALIEGGHYEFNSGVRRGGAFYVASGAGDITIAGGIVANNTASDYGGGMYILSDVTMTGGTVCSNVCSSDLYCGGGIRISGAVFTMTGGRIIDNEAKGGYGGGIAVYGSTFLMYGGEISGNRTNENDTTNYGYSGNGAGVFLDNSDFVMEGGYISDNSTEGTQGGNGEQKVNVGGGIYANAGSTITIYDGYILGNSAKRDGGGIYSLGEITMYGGVVALNSAKSSGGGVYAHGTTFTMYGGVIYGNSSTQSSYGGGGVCVYYSGTFVMYGGEIIENTSTGYGGGVYATNNTSSNDTIYLYGGEISGNMAAKGGAGVYAPSETYVSGSVVVTGNTVSGEANNIDLRSGYTLTLAGELTYGAKVGVYLEESTQTQITGSEAEGETLYRSSYRYFDADNAPDSMFVGYSSDGRYVELQNWGDVVARVDYNDGTYEYKTSLSEAFALATQTEAPDSGSATVVTLVKSVVWAEEFGGQAYEIESGKYLTLDLSGHSIYLSSDAPTAFSVYGTLTLYDSRDAYASYTGSLDVGVYDNEDGTFTTIYGKSDSDTLVTWYYSYTSGGITGGSGADSGVSAITVGAGGEFAMAGGTITGGTYYSGAAVYASGEKDSFAAVSIYGGSLSGNIATKRGGAVYASYAYIDFYGGVMAFNTAPEGGAVLIVDEGTLTTGKALGANAAEYVKEAPVFYSDSSSTYGSAVSSDSSAYVVIYDVYAEYNNAGTNGTLYLYGDAVMYGGLVAYNTADASAAGIYAGGAFDMRGGTVYGNEALSANYGGGGLYVGGNSSATVSGAKILSNITSGYGGGAYVVSGGSLSLSDTEISGNTAGRTGAGVYFLGDLSVSGTVVVTSNTAGGSESNVYLATGMYVTLDSALGEGSEIGISFESDAQTQITAAEVTTKRYSTSFRYFTLDDAGGYVVTANNVEKFVQRSTASNLAAAVTYSDGTTEYFSSYDEALTAAVTTSRSDCSLLTLVNDVETSSCFTVASGSYLGVDLAGHTIKLSGTQAFRVEGTLTLTDSEERYEFNIAYSGDDSAVTDNGDGTWTTYYSTIVNENTGAKAWHSYTSGAITNGSSSQITNGVITVPGGGDFTMYGGSIVDNYGYNSGGVVVQGTNSSSASFAMYGGSISGNRTVCYGALELQYAEARIYSGIFAANTSTQWCAVMLVSTKAEAWLGTDDADMLSALEADNPDAYRCGVVISGNSTAASTNDSASIINTSSSMNGLWMYDRVEISSNVMGAYGKGIVSLNKGAGFYGAKIIYNTSPNGAVYVIYDSTTDFAEFGDATTVSHNVTTGGVAMNVNIACESTTVYIDGYFHGSIGFTKTVSGSAATIAKNQSGYDSVKKYVFSDEGLCMGLASSNLCLFASHGEIEYEMRLTEEGYFIVYGTCSQCGDILETYGYSQLDVTITCDGVTGEYVASATLKGGTELPCTYTIDSGFIVTTGGTSTWYSNIDDALAAAGNATDSATITFFEDVGKDVEINVSGVTLDLNGFEVSKEMTVTGSGVVLDLDGGTVSGNITVSCAEGASEGGSLTIKDISADEDNPLGMGTVTGSISAESGCTVTIEGGTYSNENVVKAYIQTDTQSEGTSYNVYVSENETYTVVEGESAEAICAAYVEMTLEGGTTVRYYYASLEDAFKAVSETGGTVVLCSDGEIEGLEITSDIVIDLNGYTLDAKIKIKAEDGNGGSLKVTDSSDEKDSILTGTITVEGESTDTAEGNNSYAGTLMVDASAMNSDLKVVLYLSSTADEDIKYYFSAVTDENGVVTSYGITTEHEHSFTIPEWTLNADGTLELRLLCSCGEYRTVKSGSTETDDGTSVRDDAAVFTSGESDTALTATYNPEDGTVTYTATVTVDGVEYEYKNTITPDVMIEYTDGEENTCTLFFEDVEDALEILKDLLGDEDVSDVTMTLLGDADVGGLTVDGDLTVNLNGYELDGDITVTPDGRLTIEDDTTATTSADESGDADLVSGDGGKVTGKVTAETGTDKDTGEEKSGEVVVEGGTYDDASWSGYFDDGVETVWNEDGSYTAVSENEVKNKAAASITKVVNGEEVTTYYSSLAAALEAAEAGDTIVVLAGYDGHESVTVDEEGITIDLNGQEIEADITVTAGASLLITDSSDGDALLDGTISGNGDVTIDSGRYTQDVSEYLADGKVLYAKHDDTDDTIIYEVVSSRSFDESKAAAVITYVTSDGKKVSVYYQNIEDAVAALKDGDTLTLLSDVDEGVSLDFDAENVTLDLNGHTVEGNIYVGANASVTITDSSAYYDIVNDEYVRGSGYVSGNVTSDGTLTIEGGSYTDDVTAYVDEDGGYSVYVSKSVDDNGDPIEDGDGNPVYVYSVMPTREARSGAAASVTYTDSYGNQITVYFDDFEDAWDYACETSGNGTSSVITLYEDVTIDDENSESKLGRLVVDDGDIVLDLNGNKIYADSITVNAGSSLTIGGDGYVDAKIGTGNVESSGEAAEITVNGGTYTTDVTKYVSEGKAIIISTAEDGAKTYEVVDAATARRVAEDGNSAASVTITNESGIEVTIYFDDISDAIAFANENSDNTTGTQITVTLYHDVDASDFTDETLTIGGTENNETANVVIDLNGHDIAAGIYINAGSSLTITGSGDVEIAEGGLLGQFVAEGGTYSDDVSKYAEDGYVVIVGKNGNETTYTVMEEGAARTLAEDENSGIVASVTYTDTNGKEITVYFESIEDAVAFANANSDNEEGRQAVVTLHDDVSLTSGLTVGEEDEGTANVVIDLNGHELDAEISVDDGSSLVITGLGTVSDKDAADFLDEGYSLVAVTDATTGDTVYEVTYADEAEDFASDDGSDVVASVTYTNENGNDVTVYFDDIEEAIGFANEKSDNTTGTQVTVTLYDNIDGSDFTDGKLVIDGTEDGETANVVIDLNGHDIDADIEVEDGSSLTIEGDGNVTGSINEDDDNEGKNFGEVTINGGTYTEDVTGLAGDGKAIIVETTETVEGGENVTETTYTVTDKETGDAYASVPENGVAASVTYTNENGNEVTVYFDDIEDAIDFANAKSSNATGAETQVTVTLYDDIYESDLTDGKLVIGGTENGDTANVVIDLNGHNIDADIEVEDGSSLTIEGDGNVTGKINYDEEGTGEYGDVTINGGTYADDVSDLVGDDSVAIPSTDETGTTYTVVDKDSADDYIENNKTDIAASVTYTENGEEVTEYFESIEEAFDYVNGLLEDTSSDIGDITVKLFENVGDDAFDGDGLTIGDENSDVDVTIDLNGHDIDCDIDVNDGSSLTIEGDGNVTGTINGSEDDVTVKGGTYSQDVSGWLDENDDTVIVVGRDEDGNFTYTVTSEEEAQNMSEASVTVTTGEGESATTTTTYYESLEDALDAVSKAQEDADEGDNSTYTVTLWDDVEITEEDGTRGTLELDFDMEIDMNGFDLDSNISVGGGADVELDLNGGTFTGDAEVGDENGGATFTVTDSSAYDENGNFNAGTGVFDGDITVTDSNVEGSPNSASVEGGTYTGSGAEDLEGDGYESVHSIDDEGNDTAVIVPKDSVADFAEAYVVDEDGNNTYYESVGDAIAAVAESGGTVVLLKDAECLENIEIAANVVIDLNGHNLTVDLTINTDEGGSVKFTNSSYGIQTEAGVVSGTIKVTGSGDAGSTGNPYAETLVLADGLIVGSGLSVDLEDIQGGNAVYAMGYVTDGDDTYIGIVVTGGAETHDFKAVWTFENGKVTLSFVCDCGEWLAGGETGEIVVIEVTPEITKNTEDGTWTFTVSVTLEEGNEYGAPAGTYENEWTMYVAATVTDGEETLCFETLEEAIEYANENPGSTVTMQEDYEGEIEVSSDMTLDTNGYDFSGDISVTDGSTLTICDTADTQGTIDADFDIEDGSKVVIESGNFSESTTEEILGGLEDGSIGVADRYGLIIGSDGTGRAADLETVQDEAAASVTDGAGNTVYYEEAEDALENFGDGDTLTLWDDFDEDFTVEGNQTVDLNGYDLDGDIEIAPDSTLTVTGDGNVFADIECDEAEGEGSEDGKLVAEGGTYAADAVTKDNLPDERYVIMVNSDGSISVVTEDYAITNAAASVTDADGNVVYYEDVYTAAESLKDGDTLTLMSDVPFGTTVTIENTTDDTENTIGVTVDLNGHEINGTLEIGSDASVTVTGDGFVDTVKVDDSGKLTLKGGTYDDRDTALEYIAQSDDESEEETEYVIFVHSDSTYTVMTKEEAEEKAVAKAYVEIAYGEGCGDVYKGTLYFEDVQNAVDLVLSDVNGSEEKKVTLTDDVTADVEISSEEKFEFDTNGHTLDGDVEIGEKADVTITDGSEGPTGTITGGVYVGEGSSVGIEDVTVEGGIHAGNSTNVTVGGDSEIYGGIEAGNSSSVTAKDDSVIDGGITVDDGASGEGNESSVSVENNAFVSGGIEAGDYSDVEVTDNASVDGGISVGDNSSVSVDGNASVDGGITAGENSEVEISGGSFDEKPGADSIAEDCVIVVYPDGTYGVMAEEEAEAICDAYITSGDDGSKEYYVSFADAVEAACESDDANEVVLTGDVSCGEEIVIDGNVVIDLNGHTLNADITVGADDLKTDEYGETSGYGEGGSLKITDSTATADETTGETVPGTGKLTGSVTVKGAGYPDGEEESGGPYADTFVMTDGVSPNADLEITLDFGENSGNDEGETGYYFEKTKDGNYGIVYGTHTHDYSIEIWFYDPATGTMCLKLLCACGHYYTYTDGTDTFVATDTSREQAKDDDGNPIEGLYTITATVTVMGVNGTEQSTYSYSGTIQMAAIVTDDDGNELYFETLQDAVDYVLENGGTITLTDDITDDLTIHSETDVTIDTNGHDIGGSVLVEEGASLTIIDGSATVDEETGEIVPGTGSFSGSFVADGDLTVDGVGMTLTDDSYVSENGSFTVKGDVEINLGDNDLDIEGDFDMEGDAHLTVKGGEGSSLAIADDLEIDGDKSFTVEGVTDVEIDGKVTVSDNGELVIDATGDVKIDGDLTVGADTEDGTDSSASASITAGGSVDITGDVTVGTRDDDETTAEASIEISGGDGVTIGGDVGVYGEGEADIKAQSGDIEIDGNVTVEDAGSLAIDAEGGSVEIDGSVEVNAPSYTGEDSALIVEAAENVSIGGSVDVSDGDAEITAEEGYIDISGDVNVSNGSKLEMSADGAAEIGGNVTVSDTSSLDIEGETVDIAGKVDVLGDAEKGESAEMTVTAEESVTIGDDVTVGENAQLVITGSEDGVTDVELCGDTTVASDEGLVIGGNTSVTLGGDLETTEDGSVEFAGDTVLDINGNDVVADMKIDGNASLAIYDGSARNSGSVSGSIDVEDGGSLEMHDDTYTFSAEYDEETDSYVLATSPEITAATDESTGEAEYVMGAKADGETGEIYYVLESAENHICGYDIATGRWKLDASTAMLKVEYLCACGETVWYEMKLTVNYDYTTTVEYAEDEKTGTVTVRLTVVGTTEGGNGITYPLAVIGDVTLDNTLTKGVTNDYFKYEVLTESGCDTNGSATYTYGDGKGNYGGIVVEVTLGAYHANMQTYEGKDYDEIPDDLTIYYCPDCERYFVNTTEATASEGYIAEELVKELEGYTDFSNAVDDAVTALEETLESLTGGSDDYDDKYGAKAAIESALEELENLGYDFSGSGSSGYGEELQSAIEDIIEDALFAVEVSDAKTETENIICDEVADMLKELCMDDEDLANEIETNRDKILDSLVRIEIDKDDDIDAILAEFYRNARILLYSFDKFKAVATVGGDSDTASDYEGSVTTDGSGFAGSVDLVIVDADADTSYIEKMIGNSELVYIGGEISDDELYALVDGKEVAGVYDISLVDSITLVTVNVFSGTYTVSILIPDSLSGYSDLLVVYVGDGGTVEVYETTTKDGYLTFTTTHFSEFVIMGTPSENAGSSSQSGSAGGTAGSGDEEKETDLMPAIIALSVVAGVLLILNVVLLVWYLFRSGRINREDKKKTKAYGAIALLAVIPAGGIAIVVVLAVLSAVLLGGDVYLIYKMLTCGGISEEEALAQETAAAEGDEIGDANDSEKPDET